MYGLKTFQELWEVLDLERCEQLARRSAWISCICLIIIALRTQRLELVPFILQELGIFYMVHRSKINLWSIFIYSFIAQYIAALVVFSPITLLLFVEGGLSTLCVLLIPCVLQFIFPIWTYEIIFYLCTIGLTALFMIKGADRVILFRLFLPIVSLIIKIIAVF